MPHVKIMVTLKPTLLDAQGRVVQDALHALGYGDVGQVRIGKYMELELSEETARGSVRPCSTRRGCSMPRSQWSSRSPSSCVTPPSGWRFMRQARSRARWTNPAAP